jgi:hypothetical protein
VRISVLNVATVIMLSQTIKENYGL